MNYLAKIEQQKAEAKELARLGWKLIPNIEQTGAASIPANRGKWPPKTKYHWTSQTLLVPPSKGN